MSLVPDLDRHMTRVFLLGTLNFIVEVGLFAAGSICVSRVVVESVSHIVDPNIFILLISGLALMFFPAGRIFRSGFTKLGVDISAATESDVRSTVKAHVGKATALFVSMITLLTFILLFFVGSVVGIIVSFAIMLFSWSITIVPLTVLIFGVRYYSYFQRNNKKRPTE